MGTLQSMGEKAPLQLSFSLSCLTTAKWQNAEPSRSSPTNPPQKHIKNGRPAVGAPDGRPSGEKK